MLVSLIILIVYGMIAFYYLYRKKLVSLTREKVFALLALIVAFTIRALNLDHMSWDYTTFLSDWINYYKTHGGLSGLSDVVGNYNVPYLTFLAVISCFDSAYSLHLIKLFSVLFDVCKR